MDVERNRHIYWKDLFGMGKIHGRSLGRDEEVKSSLFSMLSSIYLLENQGGYTNKQWNLQTKVRNVNFEIFGRYMCFKAICEA